MGRIQTVAEIETSKASYEVDAWRGHGYTERYDYPCPAILYKIEGNEKIKLEEWSSLYSKNNKPVKTNFQIATEAIKKMRFYDNREIEFFYVDEFEMSSGDIIIQPNIESQNIRWECYKVGAEKVSYTDLNRSNLEEKCEGSYIIVNEDGEIKEESAKQPREIPS